MYPHVAVVVYVPFCVYVVHFHQKLRLADTTTAFCRRKRFRLSDEFVIDSNLGLHDLSGAQLLEFVTGGMCRAV